ncbi:MAG: MarR family winged helix-turn-helix transcriptional regulator [Solirubrobacterales bacterium]
MTINLDTALGPPLIGALLRMPLDAVLARMLAGLHAAGFPDLVPAHLSVLRYPGPQGRRPSDLAAATGMTKQATSYLLGELERLGYLVRSEDPEDRRSKRIDLTARGVAAAQNIRKTVRQVEADLGRELGTEDFARLRQLLVELNATSFVRDFQRRDG